MLLGLICNNASPLSTDYTAKSNPILKLNNFGLVHTNLTG